MFVTRRLVRTNQFISSFFIIIVNLTWQPYATSLIKPISKQFLRSFFSTGIWLTYYSFGNTNI